MYVVSEALDIQVASIATTNVLCTYFPAPVWQYFYTRDKFMYSIVVLMTLWSQKYLDIKPNNTATHGLALYSCYVVPKKAQKVVNLATLPPPCSLSRAHLERAGSISLWTKYSAFILIFNIYFCFNISI